MFEKLGGVTNYIISIVLLSCAAVIIKRKGAEQPGVKFVGMSVKTILIIVYFAILLYLFLLVRGLVGEIPVQTHIR